MILIRSLPALIICLVSLCFHQAVKAQQLDGASMDQSRPLKPGSFLSGFVIGDSTRILPYLSLNGGFSPYLGLKLEHTSFLNSADKMLYHGKFENKNDYSLKLRYLARSISSQSMQHSLLFKVKSDMGSYFYGFGNTIQKAARSPATYYSVFIGGETEWVNGHAGTSVRVSSGIWRFRSGLHDGSEFEQASDTQYLTTRVTLSHGKDLNYWQPSEDHNWSAYAEIGVPTSASTSSYARINLEGRTIVPLTDRSRLSLGSRLEFLVSPDRHLVPYFAYPEVGAGSGLRGYAKERFRNTTVLAVQFEYSMHLTSGIEGILLTDIAQTASNYDLLRTKGIHQSVGAGIRLNKIKYPVSFGVAAGRESIKLFSSIGLGRAW